MRPTFTVADIFETPARAKVLRTLALASCPLSGRGVGRAAALSHTSASATLRDLQSMGLVECHAVGRANAFQLVRENAFVRHMVLPAVAGERAVVRDLCADLASTFGPGSVSVILFGSWAYGEQDDESDIDVLVIALDERRKQQLEEVALEHSHRFHRTYSSPLSLLAYTFAEARDCLGIDKSALRLELESTGIILHGLGPREWGIDEPESAGT